MIKYDTQRPYAASYLIIRRADKKVAFVLRTNTGWADGLYTVPAGKVEHNELPSETALRGAGEEIGITLTPDAIKCVHVAHRNQETQWVDFFFEASSYAGEPYNAEPNKHGELVWFELDDLPENIIPSLRYALSQYSLGETYSEYSGV